MIRIQFNRNFKVQVYQELAKSKRLNYIYRINGSILTINRSDLEETDRIFDRLILKYKVVQKATLQD